MALRYVLEVQDKATATLRKFQGDVDKSAQKATGAKGAFLASSQALFAVGAGAAAAYGALLTMTSVMADNAKEVSNFARLAGETPEDFQRMAFGAKAFGVEQDKLGDILKDVNDKVGDFLTTGGGGMKDFFEKIAPKVGVTADQFRGLSGKDALQLYVNTLEKANVSQAEMTFHLEAIASDATLLQPLLENNGKAMRQMGDEVGRTGAIMSSELINSLKEFTYQMDLVESTAKGAFNGIAEETTPIINEAMPDIILATQNFSDAIQSLAATSKTAFSFITQELADIALGWSQIAKEITNAIDLKIDFTGLEDPEIQALLDKQAKANDERLKKQKAAEQEAAAARAKQQAEEAKLEAQKKKWADEAKKRREQDAKDAIEKNRQIAEAILDEEEATQAQIKAWDDEILAMDQANAEARKATEREVTLALMSESDRRKLFIEEEYQARVDVLGKTAEVEMLRMREVEELRKEQEAKKREDLLNTFSQISEGANLFGSTLENLNQAEQNRINQNFDEKKRKIEEEFALQAEGAQGNAALLESIQRSRDEKLKALDLKREKDLQKAARRTATMRKRAAQVEAIVNTAAAVTKALPNIPLSILVGLQGASQVALIESQQFFKGGMTDQGPQQISVGENGREFVVSASGTRAAGEDALQDLNNGRLEDAANRLLAQSGQSSGGVTIQIMGGVVDEMFMQNVLIPKLERYQRRF